MKNKKLIHTATFGQAKGLQGEIKINIHTESLKSFKMINQFFMEDGISQIIFKSIKANGSKYTAFIEGCKNRDIAETYKGKKIFTFRKNLPKINNNNEFYVNDLIGCKVFNKQKKDLGNIIDVKNFGAGDLMEINNHNKSFFIPMNNENLININLDKMIVVVDPILGLLD